MDLAPGLDREADMAGREADRVVPAADRDTDLAESDTGRRPERTSRCCPPDTLLGRLDWDINSYS